jgi:hypothetical protein
MSEQKYNRDEEKGDRRTSIEAGTVGILVGNDVTYENGNEVFQKTSDGIDYRTVGMKRALFVIFKGRYTPRFCFEFCMLTFLPLSGFFLGNSQPSFHFVIPGGFRGVSVYCGMGYTQYM